MGDIVTGLKSHWRLDESTGLFAADSKGGHTADLKNMGGNEWTPAIINNGLALDGFNKYLAVAHHADFNFNNFTLAMWVKILSFAHVWNVLINKGAANDRNFAFQFSNAGVLLGGYEQSGGANHFAVSGAGYVTTGVWRHLACTYNGTVVKLFKDSANNPGFDHASAIAPATNTADVRLAADNTPQFFSHIISDDIRLYNRALSQADMNDLFAWRGDPAVGGAVPAGIFEGSH